MVLHNIYIVIVPPIVNQWGVASTRPMLKGVATNGDSIRRRMRWMGKESTWSKTSISHHVYKIVWMLYTWTVPTTVL